MIRIHQIRMKPDHTKEELKEKLLRQLGIGQEALLSYQIVKQSIDARKKPQIFFTYAIDVSVRQEDEVLRRHRKNADIRQVTDKPYHFVEHGSLPLRHRPVIVGSGPAGLFCAYMLAREGYRPLLIEQGAPVEERIRDVECFWQGKELKPYSNVQFGEGGAGTFSDGKLNTLVKDVSGRNRKVLEIFVEHGAPEEILYLHKPHLGTDLLSDIVSRIRKSIIAFGGEVRFHTRLTGIEIKENKLFGIRLNDSEILPADPLVLAIGHSARETFDLLHQAGVEMQAKSFAVGVRVEHPQDLIDQWQYGNASHSLPAAPYKLAETLPSGRGVYTFCMCPGGYVVNASSEKGRLAVNGMSYQDRAGKNANSAVIVTVSPADYGGDHPLAGIEFQRLLEERAFGVGKGKVPVQCFGDFCSNQVTKELGEISPQIKGEYTFANIKEILPPFISDALEQGIKKFNDKIHGFSRSDTVLIAVESRTSSPVRILRDEHLSASVRGIYPCGEGAGYAGGITSAAMDGIKTAEAIALTYRSYD